MCGIAGLVHFNNRPQVSPVESMLQRLEHRGPDGGGVWQDSHAVLGHRRLSIIDLDDRAAQPMKDLSERYVLTFNGEIYNYRDLRALLTSKHGSIFRTESDSEIILEAFKVW